MLRIKELTFSATHYIPFHPKCSAIHGHTYFVKDICIEVDGFVDFGKIKQVIKNWDHSFIVPKDHVDIWLDIWRQETMKERHGIALNIRFVDGDPTVENIAKHIKEEIDNIPHVVNAGFELCEGPNQGEIVA